MKVILLVLLICFVASSIKDEKGQYMAGFFLQTAADPLIWEEVDEYTWGNWDKAISQDKQRYSGNRVMVNEKGIEIKCENITSRELSIISRFCGADKVINAAIPGGFVRKPEIIRFRKRSQMVLHEVGGKDYICRIKQTETA